MSKIVNENTVILETSANSYLYAIAGVYFSLGELVNMSSKIHKSVFAAMIEDLKDVNNHKFDFLEVKTDSKEKKIQTKSATKVLFDLDYDDSDSEFSSDRTGGFLFKDTYFEDREVENLVLEYDPVNQCTKCQCTDCEIEPLKSESDQSSEEKTKSGKKD